MLIYFEATRTKEVCVLPMFKLVPDSPQNNPAYWKPLNFSKAYGLAIHINFISLRPHVV